MNLLEIQKVAKKLYYPIFLLEDIISHRIRKQIAQVLLIITVLVFASGAILYGSDTYLHLNKFSFFVTKLIGTGFITFSLWTIFFATNAFFYSFYFRRPEETNGLFIDLDLAYSICKLDPKDITGSFFSLLLGSRFLLRTGIRAEKMKDFLAKRKSTLTAEKFQCDISDNILNLIDFTLGLYENDEELKQFLFSQGIQRKDLVAIAEWIMEIHATRHSLEGWWSKENLVRIPGIGQSWSYGQTFNLKKYERELPFASNRGYGVHTSYGEAELHEIEAILAKNRQGNALLIGDDVAGQLQIIYRLNQAIINGDSLPELKEKRTVIMDVDLLTSRNPTKAVFESEFINVLNEATYAGNIILVIDNMPAFVSSVATFGTDLPSLLESYMNSPALKIIALSSVDLFHNTLEKNSIFMQSFEVVQLKEVDDLNTIRILENEIIKFEARGMLFTYLALNEIVTSATRYFPNAIMPDKAIDLLSEIVPKLEAEGKTIVEKTDIQKLVEVKTGIPTGVVKEKERDKLLNLENILRSRIVGQEEAITAISNSMRRARSGIENPDRPLGSFLFLGPTGVGKTETTKALTEVFFGSDKHVMRLDMSEYSTFDATTKLIGSFETSQSGVLSSMLREHPYGVLLLDEFEKTTKEVMNLFLQILDEGFFSDGLGKKVMARNLMIIATSNAGSSMIWNNQKLGKDLASEKDSILDSIIKDKIFTPELLNRFDGVILFHPLSDIELRKIAELSLIKLKSRLAEKGMDLVINVELIDFVVSHGADPKFGARPINRAISDDVEQLVAKKIISGELKPGSQIIFSREDFLIDDN
ncbi:MAG: AAA family ATPase [Minisyncoccia bacterium]